jgi:hypothetical protein
MPQKEKILRSFNNVTAKCQVNTFKSLITKGRNTYHLAPHSIRWIFWPLRLTYKLCNAFLLELWILSGKETSSGQELSIIFAGHTVDRNYFANLVFGDSFQKKYMGRKLLWDILKKVKTEKESCSLAIVELHHNLISMYKRLNCFYVPSWISGSIDLSNYKSMISINKNTSLKSDINKIKKNKLNFKISHEMTQLKNFYYNMYKPYIEKVYGDRSIEFSTYEFVSKEFRKQGAFKDLLLIKKGNECIAGALLYYKDKYAKLSTLGIKDGNLNYVRDGAIGAIYYFSTLYFEKNGFKNISLGGSRPFLKDGVLRYKRKWKPKISHFKNSGFLIKMLSDTKGSKGFFLKNPFIFEDVSGFNAAIFVEAKQNLSEKDFENIYKNYYHPGISKLMVYRFDSLNTNEDYSIPKSLSDIISVQPWNRYYAN